MNRTSFLKLEGRDAIELTKDFFTVGYGDGYDLSLSEGKNRILFSIQKRESQYSIIPGSEKILLNGKAMGRLAILTSLDQISWKEERAIFSDSEWRSPVSHRAERTVDGYAILKKLSESLEGEVALSLCLQDSLKLLIEMSGAESGTFVTEVGSEGSWRVLATQGNPLLGRSTIDNPRDLLSDTILNKAISERRTVYLESVVGHPLGSQTSILDARIFSLACVPLTVGERVFGAVYLSTRSIGQSIRSECLEELKTVATHVALVLAYQTELRKNRRQPSRVPSGKPLLFDQKDPSSPMYRLMERLTKLAQSDLNLLIRGETGTGKELIAREIHKQSRRAAGPFIAVNCAAIPQGLLESTLFGHARGAFTAALRDHNGKFLQANGGTLFLDEIGEIPAPLQAKLLRVIQEKEIEPVGSEKSVRSDFRVIAATHADLETLIRDGGFRSDLYYRLNGATLEVPPLRHRKTEIALLAIYFLTSHYPDTSFSKEAMERLLGHPWPGNVRELEQAVLRAAALSAGAEVLADDFELGAGTPFPPDFSEFEDSKTLRDFQFEITKEYVQRVLAKYHGNRSRASAHLGISERTLYRMLASDTGDIPL